MATRDLAASTPIPWAVDSAPSTPLDDRIGYDAVGNRTAYLSHGADVRQVQELLGHKSLQTTQIYTRVVAQDLRGMLERSHPREQRRRR